MEYYILLVEKNGDALARVIGTSPSSSTARELAQALDVKHHGRITGRTFYLDHDALISWRSQGKIAPIGSLRPELDIRAPG
ncbi:hypothetical protein [Halochromatium roseum]|jgi:hypothetical protein|uniref:hypothetical protein n=1 Tax=Halochromatium roseum TaxID=391920 RepID=UPI0019132FEA|nr:hypothetical protein [Halochromatium roseum]MBK5939428.1 hypothetical protein [Halochromatium roseum]